MLIALATKHEKEKQISPIFQRLLGWKIVNADFDTDQLGTFSGEVDRRKSPREAAIAKATAAARIAGTEFGIASEGTIGHNPAYPFTTSDHELIAFVDLKKNVQIVESHISPNIVAVQQALEEELNLEEFVKKADLPDHALILRNSGPRVTWAQKGLKSLAEVIQALEQARLIHPLNQLVLESDFRAMCSPSRQRNIAICAEKLASRLASKCPECGYLGWGIVGYETGLPCEVCGDVSPNAIRADRFGCLACGHEILVERPEKSIGPARCNVCNP